MARMSYPPTDCRSYIKIIMSTYLTSNTFQYIPITSFACETQIYYFPCFMLVFVIKGKYEQLLIFYEYAYIAINP